AGSAARLGGSAGARGVLPAGAEPACDSGGDAVPRQHDHSAAAAGRRTAGTVLAQSGSCLPHGGGGAPRGPRPATAPALVAGAAPAPALALERVLVRGERAAGDVRREGLRGLGHGGREVRVLLDEPRHPAG